jgi:hypothetical protein
VVRVVGETLPVWKEAGKQANPTFNRYPDCCAEVPVVKGTWRDPACLERGWKAGVSLSFNLLPDCCAKVQVRSRQTVSNPPTG